MPSLYEPSSYDSLASSVLASSGMSSSMASVRAKHICPRWSSGPEYREVDTNAPKF